MRRRLHPLVAERRHGGGCRHQPWLLAQAMKQILIGTACATWTGIGAMGVAVLGIVLFNGSASPARLACVALIVAGVIGLKLVST